MKRQIYLVFFVLLTTIAYSQTLDSVVEEAARRVSERLPQGSTVVMIEFTSAFERLSNHVIDEMNDILVNIGKVRPVERRRLNTIRAELNLGMQGEISDESAQRIGQMAGAQYIIIGSIDLIGIQYRVRFQAITTETAIIELSFTQNIISDSVLLGFLGGSGTVGGGQATAVTSGTTASDSGQVAQTPLPPTAPTSSMAQVAQTPGFMIQGRSLTEKFEWLESNATSNTHYIIEISGNESLRPQNLSYEDRTNIIIRIRGLERERIVTLSSSGSLFSIGAGVTLILENNVTLRGRSSNDASLVTINNNGEFEMNTGAKITSNISFAGGGGVTVNEGNFIMKGGEINGNGTSWLRNHNRGGGGVSVLDGGIFTMSGGSISGNTTDHGGGGSELGGGGVRLYYGTFTMTGGTITNNNTTVGRANSCGGGVYVGENSSFNMSGGEISSNITANTGTGGGVYIVSSGRFTKTGGTISGSAEGENNRNRGGSAVYVASNPFRHRRSTAGPRVNLDSTRTGAAGGWEN